MPNVQHSVHCTVVATCLKSRIDIGDTHICSWLHVAQCHIWLCCRGRGWFSSLSLSLSFFLLERKQTTSWHHNYYKQKWKKKGSVIWVMRHVAGATFGRWATRFLANQSASQAVNQLCVFCQKSLHNSRFGRFFAPFHLSAFRICGRVAQLLNLPPVARANTK